MNYTEYFNKQKYYIDRAIKARQNGDTEAESLWYMAAKELKVSE